MRKFFVTFMASLLSCSAAFAFWPEAADSDFELGVGYRKDKLSWTHHANILVDDNPVGLTSKVQWRDLNIWQIDAKFKYLTCDNIYLRARADYGWITHGKVKRDLYAEVGETIDATGSGYSGYSGSGFNSFGSNSDGVELASFHHKARRGHVYDADLALGYQFKMCDDGLALTPVVGYAWDGQHLELGHNNSSSSDSYSYSYGYSYSPATVATGSDYSGNNLNSRFHTRWNGPFIGVDLDYKWGCEWDFFATYEFHWARYHSKARFFNFRGDLTDHFYQRSKSAYGHVASVGVKYDFCECWTLALIGEWRYFRANHGRDRFEVAEASEGDLQTRCFLYSPVRHITWQSASITANVGMLF